MADLSKMIEALKKNPKKIVFTEGTDERILKAAERLSEDSFLQPVLVGKKEEIIEDDFDYSEYENIEDECAKKEEKELRNVDTESRRH